MKKLRYVSFFFFCMLSSVQAQQCYDNNLLYLNNSAECVPGVSSDPWPGSLPTNCSVQSASLSAGCLFLKFHICCDMEQQKYEDSKIDVTSITVPIDTERDAADAAYDVWKGNSASYAACASGYYQAGTFSAMKFQAFPSETTPGSSDVYVGFRSRTLCSKSSGGFSNYSVQPLPTSGGGSGGSGSTDMTATNTLIGQSNTLLIGIDQKLAAGTGSGGSTNVAGVETRLDSVNSSVGAVGSSVDSLSTKLDGVYTGGNGSGQPAPTIDKAGKETAFLDASASQFSSFQTSVKGTALYNSIGTFFNGVPSGGQSVFTVEAGRLGHHRIDLADYSNAWNIIKALVLISCSYVSIKIIFLGRA